MMMRNLLLHRFPNQNLILHRPIPIPIPIPIPFSPNSNSLPFNRPSTLSFAQGANGIHNTPAQNEIMGVSKEELESSLTSKLAPSHLEVVDTSGGCGASFMVEIVSEQFEGKRLLERHRMVNAALEKELKEIHALSITKVLTPQQWKQQQEAAAKVDPAT